MAGVPGPQPVAGKPPAFVGRAAARAWFNALLTDAADGEARVGLISGPAGIGKTRLLLECLDTADQRDWLTLYGRCSEGSPVERSPFETVLRPRIAQVQRRAARRDKAGIGPGDSANLAAEAATLASGSLALASRRPFVFVVDDLHHADAATLDFLSEYVRNLGDLAREKRVPLFLLAAHHPAWSGQPLEATCRRILREPLAAAFELRGLEETEVQQLVSRAAASHCEPSLLEHMMARTAGNPFFVLELLRQLERHGLLVQHDGQVTATAPLDALALPFDAPAAVNDRLQSLPTDLRDSLHAAAVIGEEFDLASLALLVDAPPMAASFEPAVSSGLVQLHANDTFAFTHDIVRQSLLETMSPIQRRDFHRQLATALQERAAKDTALRINAAVHLLAAGDPLDGDGAAFVDRVGDDAMDAAAWSVGCSCYEAAIACESYCASLGDGALGWLFARAARANDNAANGVRARELYARAIEHFRSAGDFDGWGTALLGWQRSFILANEPLPPRDAIDDFLRSSGHAASDKRIRLMALHAESLWIRRDPGDLAAAREAVEAAATTSDPEVAAFAWATLGLAQFRHLDPPAAEESFRLASSLADAVRSPRVKSLGRARIALPLILSGQVRNAAAAVNDDLVLARAGSDWPHSALSLSLLYVVASLRGDTDTAVRARIDASLMVSRSGYVFALFILDAAVALDRMLRGEFEEAEDAANAWGHIAGRSASRPLLALLRERAGQNAPEPFDPSLPRGVDFIALGSVATLIELADHRGDAELAHHAAGLLAPLVERGVMLSIAPPLLLPRLLAVAARLGGRFDEASGYLEQAALLATAEGLAVELAHITFERAKLAVARGEADAAAAPLSNALQSFAALDLPWALSAGRAFASQHRVPTGDFPLADSPIDDLSVTEFEVLSELARGATPTQTAERLLLHERTVERHLGRLASRLGVRSERQAREALKAASGSPSRDRRGPRADELTPREREVLQLIALGYSNQQIADELVISPHTAIRHVANILEKTGAANRTEAARLV